MVRVTDADLKEKYTASYGAVCARYAKDGQACTIGPGGVGGTCAYCNHKGNSSCEKKGTPSLQVQSSKKRPFLASPVQVQKKARPSSPRREDTPAPDGEGGEDEDEGGEEEEQVEQARQALFDTEYLRKLLDPDGRSKAYARELPVFVDSVIRAIATLRQAGVKTYGDMVHWRTVSTGVEISLTAAELPYAEELDLVCSEAMDRLDKEYDGIHTGGAAVAGDGGAAKAAGEKAGQEVQPSQPEAVQGPVAPEA